MFSTTKLLLMSKNRMSAIGGSVSYFGDYAIHTFTSSSTLTISGEGYTDILVVAGGGGGGSFGAKGAGGGGAGGLIYYVNSDFLGPGIYAITVGFGGGVASNGQSSSIILQGDSTKNIIAIGGGRGGNGENLGNQNGGNGGSGGGGGFKYGSRWGYRGPPGVGTPGQGNNGGYPSGGNYVGGAGGGGAVGVGGNAVRLNLGYQQGGPGGVGRLIDITGTARYYAGGGAGHGQHGNNVGGAGGGGSTGAAGSANTGGGGGANAPGGSGIIIVRYLR